MSTGHQIARSGWPDKSGKFGQFVVPQGIGMIFYRSGTNSQKILHFGPKKLAFFRKVC
jgi:hypothetical protein